MIGALIGDIVGSVYEFHNIHTKDFPFFREDCHPTDDSIMTLALAQSLMEYEDSARTVDLKSRAVQNMRQFGRRHPYGGYGGQFLQWLTTEDPKPYCSLGNGAAMRVSACGFMADTLEEALFLAEQVTEVTHNHPEGLKGAKCTAGCIWMARAGKTKDEIRTFIEDNYYPMDFTLEEIRDTFAFDETCMGTVPQALEMFMESTDYEDCIRTCISMGGDCDTTSAIAGAVAEAFYGVPKGLAEEGRAFLPGDLRKVYDTFNARYPSNLTK
ncbi:MAG TPA: ADP-ribosylglycohydrolase family protein [Clostridiales bacterium]|nr:ADP-ribosylglycohydrolase family protein [Clostridiales bacterium]